MITDAQIDVVLAEMTRLRARIEELRVAQAANKDRGYPRYDCPRESGAVRRASMDLTRELAKLRSYAR